MNLTSIIISLSIAVLLTTLFWASRNAPKIDAQGNKILKLPVFILIFGALTAIGAVIVLIYGLISCKPGEELATIILFLMIGGLGIPLLLMGWFFHIIIKEDGIENRTMLGKTKFIKWTDIKSVSFSKVSMEMKIQSENTKIKVVMYSQGFDELVNEIGKRTNFNRLNIGLP